MCVCTHALTHTHTHSHTFFFSGEEDSKTSAKEDLKSYEETASTTPNTHQVPRSLEPQRTIDMLKKGRVQLVCNVC